MNKENKNLIYLNNAATSFPKPKAVKDAVLNSLDNFTSAGRSGNLDGDLILTRARNLIAKLFKIHNPNRVIFTQNCTEALNYAIKGILEKGDHVILDNVSHNSLARPLITLEKNGIISISKINPKNNFYFDPDEIKSLITNKTKLIAITHASNVTGIIQDLNLIGEITKDKNIYFLVDAAQSAGQIDIDVNKSHIDFLATAGHKSLYGPTGTGILYVSERVQNLKTIKEGGTGSHSEELLQPTNFPHMLESGTHNLIGISGLLAGIEFILNEGLEKIRCHELSLTQAFIDGIKELKKVKTYGLTDAQKICSVVSFTIEDYSVADCGLILQDSFNLLVRTGLHCSSLAHSFLGTINTGGTIRVSPGYFNTMEDIHIAINAVKELASAN